MRLFRAAVVIALGLSTCLSLRAASPGSHYKIEDIAFPPDVPPEVGGLDFDANGLLYVSLRRGDVLTARPAADPKAFPWQLFATGFENGTGLVAPEPGRILVSQMAELTEASDTDGDGRADRYRMVVDDWGLSGNYHETNSIVRDGRGGYFLMLGTASHNGPVFEFTKGEYSKVGRRGRNFSAVEFRGWTMHLTPDGALRPFASGFRMQNGACLDAEGNLWSSDNQGDWKAVTPFYHVEKGKFYGHPSSLVWDPNWPADKDPLLTYRDDLAAYNEHRTPAAVEIPHREICRSGSQPAQIPVDGSFGPFAGQMLLPDNNSPRIARIMLERVEGEFQGAVTLFIQENGLRSGNNRLQFSPDGKQLYVGQTVRGWGKPAEGLQRITWGGEVPFTVEQVAIMPGGFRITFTHPVNAGARDAASYVVRSMIYQPRWTYGSDPEDVRTEAVSRVQLRDARTVEVTVPGLQAGRVYHFEFGSGLQAAGGATMGFPHVYYTANRVPAS